MVDPANATMMKAKTLPSENPNIALATINPSAAKPPIASIGPSHEKSLLVIKIVNVRPRNSPIDTMPALRMTVGSPDAYAAIYSSGTNINASAKKKTPRQKYCEAADVSDTAHRSASHEANIK